MADADTLAVISDRRRSGEHRGDLLDLMLDGKDPQTGLSLGEENIRFQVGCHQAGTDSVLILFSFSHS